MKRLLVKILLAFLILVVSTLTVPSNFAQDKQDNRKDLMESYIGRWRGNITSKNISRGGGWGNGFLGYHAISKDVGTICFDVKFMHPLDDPAVIEETRKLGIPIEYYKNLMPIPDELTISGYAILKDFYYEYTHITREYCEECAGKDGTTREDFPEVVIPVSGRIDLVRNKIDFDCNIPEKHPSIVVFLSDPKLVESGKIEFNFENFEEPNDGVYAIEQIAKGELYRIYTKKDTLGKTVFIKEPIKTDKFTQREIVVPNVGEVVVNTNSECKFNTDKELEQMMGEIYKRIKKLPPDDFKVRTPQAVCGVRGTQFITKVNGDTTTITVYEGEVEFSDINKKKTVIVRSNQTSFCTNGGQPIEPVNIDPKQALKWWE